MAEVKTYNREFSHGTSRTVVTGSREPVGALPRIDNSIVFQCSQGVAGFQKRDLSQETFLALDLL